jgi:hypothetical protein
LDPGPGGLGFGAAHNPGGLEGANAGSVGSGKRAQAFLALVAGAALLVLSRAKPTGEYEVARGAERPAGESR